MSLDPGARLGPYAIEAPLGAGGMGEVYKAQDTRLGRMVAIKVLPESVAEDPERLARFEREAKLLASLNHPNIAALYGLEESGEIPALVMELVEGPTLEDRIRQGALPLDETLRITRQIAEAMEYAHAHGIIHRDLKPANVKLTDDDRVKVLDFGLAKALDPASGASGSIDLSHSPTLTYQATMAGVILGTAAYMSPEQARGKAADKQADVWALGCLAYEMLTGARAFAGETVSDTLAAVLRAEPDWDALPPELGTRLRRVLARCLEKDPRRRFHSALDAAVEMEGAASRDAEGERRMPLATASRRGSWLPWSLAALCALVAVALGMLTLRKEPQSGPSSLLTRFDLQLPIGERLALPDSSNLAISPDGRRVALVTTDDKTRERHLLVRELSSAAFRPVAETDGATSPFFSPDGAQIGFFADGKLKRVSAEGGNLSELAEATQPRGGTWLSDGSIVFSPTYVSGLVRVSSNGGPTKTLVSPDAGKHERTYRWPDLLPHDRGVLFTIGKQNSPQSYVDADIAVLDLATHRTKTLLHGGTCARFLAPDRIIYLRQGELVTQQIDLDHLELLGEPRPAHVGIGGDPTSGVGYFAVSRDGTLIWVSGEMAQRSGHLTLVDRSGHATPLNLQRASYFWPTFSPDGKTVAMNIGQGQSGRTDGDIWLLNLASLDLTRLTFDRVDTTPIFSPDGKQIAYVVSEGKEAGVSRKAADGSGSAAPIGSRSSEPRLLSNWSPDGKTIAYTAFSDTIDTYLMDVATGEKTLFAKGGGGADFSPDGRYLTYTAVPQEGPPNILVRAVSGDGQWQVSTDGGAYSRWSADGREIFYINHDELMRVPVSTQSTFHAGTPEKLFGDLQRFTYNATMTNYAVSPDGQTFVFVAPEENTATDRVAVALNWAQGAASNER